MSLFESSEKLSKLFLSQRNVLELAKIDLLVDDRLTSPIPSYAIENDCLSIIETNHLEDEIIDGIPIRNINYLDAVLYWHQNPTAYCFHKAVKPFILDIDPCDYIAATEFYRIPKYGMYCEIDYKDYYGFLVGWDYILDQDDNQIDILNICWLSASNKGLVFSFSLPKKYEVIALDEFKDKPYFDEFEKFIGILLYVLNQNGTQETALVNGNKYIKLGNELGKKIEENSDEKSGRIGHWRRAHLHLYWRVINGVKVAVYKWLDPIWVSPSTGESKDKTKQKK